jgi:hypothetical protein
MGACMLSYTNFADQASLSGGDWSATMPLANLLDPTIGIKARSVDDAAVSTQFDADLASAVGVKIWCLVAHNLSAGATIRLRASNTAGDFATPLYDSGTVGAWSTSYLASATPWESDAFWDSVITSSGLDGGQPTLIHILPTETAARYWRFEVTDTTNNDGYVEAGRLYVGRAFQPAANFSWGASVGYIDESVAEQAFSGSEYFEQRPVRRVASVRFEFLTDSEALINVLDIQRLRGTTREILFIWDPDDLEFSSRRSFLARQQELSAIELVRLGNHATALKLRELL